VGFEDGEDLTDNVSNNVTFYAFCLRDFDVTQTTGLGRKTQRKLLAMVQNSKIKKELSGVLARLLCGIFLSFYRTGAA
jgi:hypothetical protein